MSNVLTLAKIKNTDIADIYRKFIIGEKLEYKDYEALLGVAIMCIASKTPDVRKFGYRIVVEYCNQTEDYGPLYEIAINKGLYPISKFINEHYIPEDKQNFYSLWNDAYTEQFSGPGGIYQSAEQKRLSSFFAKEEKSTVSVIAPTSYGKSELILSAVDEFKGKNICIITSTKALLMQTKKRLLDHFGCNKKKIIVHPEMYTKGDTPCIAVLTQERMLRLLKKDPDLSFDCIVMDEAHEMLDDNQRSILLSYVIIVAKKRNPNVVFKFLTPFLKDSDNLKTRYADYEIKPFSVSEYVKTEKFYLVDLCKEHTIRFYDQFFNEFIDLSEVNPNCTEEEFIIEHGSYKNIVYLNKPVDIEDFALKLEAKLPVVDSEIIKEACDSISNYISPQYNLVRCLRKGIIYHHGSVPDAIRVYIEDLYRKTDCIKYVITSSTLLSGVNLPAERMFILDNRKGAKNLSYSQFRNLVGRVCRFSTIFNKEKGSLKLLEPKIFLMNGCYFMKNANCENYLREVANLSKEYSDSVENVVMENSANAENSDELKVATEFLENYENGVIDSYSDRLVTTEIGQACIMNGITEFDVFKSEQQMQEKLELYRNKYSKIESTYLLMMVLLDLFFCFAQDDRRGKKIKGLQNPAALRFYSIKFRDKMENASYPELVKRQWGYWMNIEDDYIYVDKWGDTVKPNCGNKQYYINKHTKNNRQMINLAIVRIKEEQDFVDNILMKFVEVLNDVGLIDESLYNNIKYGSDDPYVICLMKNGLSLSTSLLLVSKYEKYLDFNILNSKVDYDSDLLAVMEENNENKVMLYEVKNYL